MSTEINAFNISDEDIIEFLRQARFSNLNCLSCVKWGDCRYSNTQFVCDKYSPNDATIRDCKGLIRRVFIGYMSGDQMRAEIKKG